MIGAYHMPNEPTQRMIYVNFQREGIHKYPAALTDPALAEETNYE